MKTLLVSSMALLCLCCGEGDDRGGKVVRNRAKLTKLTAASQTPFLFRAIGDTAPMANRTSPANLSGDLCYAILSLGDLGPGMWAMTWLAPEETFPDGPESGTCSAVQFDLANPFTISNSVLVPETEGDMPSHQIIGRVELSFNYVDATFQVSDTAPVYTIRTVYASTATASDVTGIMQRGDKLIRLPGETAFQWANSAGTSTSRQEVETGLFADKTVTGYKFPGQGNPDYVPVTANFYEELPVTYALITDSTKIWTLEFDLSNAILWENDPTTFTSPQAYVAAFRLKFGPNQTTTMGEADDGIRARLRIDDGTVSQP
ncbi:MAG: hypothetical protein JXX14_12070 [Deltaproteobacteria bacterium]|nr:hypothetical protein [Deltaproteobacteria bacterium]